MTGVRDSPWALAVDALSLVGADNDLETNYLVQPLFFGPSRTYISERSTAFQDKHSVRLARLGLPLANLGYVSVSLFIVYLGRGKAYVSGHSSSCHRRT